MKSFISRIGIVPRTFALGLLIGAGAIGTAWASQPHMVNALHDLQAAQGQLNVATPDKGGHRNQALNYVNQAIAQVEQGINYSR